MLLLQCSERSNAEEAMQWNVKHVYIRRQSGNAAVFIYASSLHSSPTRSLPRTRTASSISCISSPRSLLSPGNQCGEMTPNSTTKLDIPDIGAVLPKAARRHRSKRSRRRQASGAYVGRWSADLVLGELKCSVWNCLIGKWFVRKLPNRGIDRRRQSMPEEERKDRLKTGRSTVARDVKEV